MLVCMDATDEEIQDPESLRSARGKWATMQYRSAGNPAFITCQETQFEDLLVAPLKRTVHRAIEAALIPGAQAARFAGVEGS